MIYIGLALYAEGRTDDYFLQPLLQRLCEDLCLGGATQAVDIGGVVRLDDVSNAKDRHVRVVEAARQHLGAWQILFVHTDGAGDPDAARRERTEPSLMALEQAFLGKGLGVPVVPVRETEAWAVCDGEALRQVLGTTLTDRELGLPDSPRAAENLTDPKAVLDEAFLATNPTQKRRRSGVSPLLNALGETVSLARLRQIPSFVVLETDLRHVLQRLRVLA